MPMVIPEMYLRDIEMAKYSTSLEGPGYMELNCMVNWKPRLSDYCLCYEL